MVRYCFPQPFVQASLLIFYSLDHAFLIQRVGHTAVSSLQKGFTHANTPFHCAIKSLIPTTSGCVLEGVWHGKLANDIIRPDGQIAVKASGKEFVTHVCLILEIDAEGKVRRIDEYVRKDWDEGLGEEEYVVMRGASVKD